MILSRRAVTAPKMTHIDMGPCLSIALRFSVSQITP
jgi:hypothetical protein